MSAVGYTPIKRAPTSCMGLMEYTTPPGADPGGAPPNIGKNMIYLRKIVIFHTKYPKHCRTSLRNWIKYDSLA